ncbi:uncharacterized protein LOC129800013 [Phlebotomus papatasi]|uniref:uncharacterized protein LOC129800013 n=1 Tax=Phlebotomus papatasi TaxID=29031 RepID=UPI002483F631|nr:uncharacterized protein LOC129800013 [Phlebotomus papatasi]
MAENMKTEDFQKWKYTRKNKPKNSCHNFFKTVGDSDDHVICEFCQWTCNRNATRMTQHLIKKCREIPEEIKQNLEAHKGSDSTDLFPKNDTTSGTVSESQSQNLEEAPDQGSSTDSESTYKMSAEEKKNIDEKLTRAFYSSPASLRLFDNIYFREAIKIMNPHYELLSKKELRRIRRAQLQNSTASTRSRRTRRTHSMIDRIPQNFFESPPEM